MESRLNDPGTEPDPYVAPDLGTSVDPEPETVVRRYEITGKANLLKRFVALFIDGVIAAVLSIVPLIGYLVAGAYILVRDGMEYDFMDRRSIGKKIMNLRPISLKGEPMDLNLSIRRNWPLALGYLGAFLADISIFFSIFAVLGLFSLVEAVLVLTDDLGRRYGDRFAETIVIEVDD